MLSKTLRSEISAPKGANGPFARMVARSQFEPELVYHIAFLSIATVNWTCVHRAVEEGFVGNLVQICWAFPFHVRTQNNLVELETSRQAVLR